MIVYLDTSVVLRILLRQEPRLEQWAKWDEAYSSALLGVEARRTLDRLRLEAALDDKSLAQVHQELASIELTLGSVPVTRAVLDRASLPMSSVVRTLDSFHLATALLLRERVAPEILFATHDARQALAAQALGFDCIGV